MDRKKWIGPMLIVLLWAAAGCKETPRERILAEGLVLYTEVDETGDTLTGVRRTADSTVLVVPAAYREVRAEEHFIVCRRGEYSYEVFFRNDGKRLGKFDTFTRMVRDSCDYYLGTSYRTSCFYFPKQAQVVRAQEVEILPRCIRLKVNGEWQERDFEGRGISR